jgi:hypothetical protein
LSPGHGSEHCVTPARRFGQRVGNPQTFCSELPILVTTSTQISIMTGSNLPEEVQTFLDSKPYIPHRNAELILNELEFIFEHHLDTGVALGERLAGPTNAGKTTVMAEFLRRHPPTMTESGWQHPVLYAHLPEKAKLTDVYSAVLKALGDPAYAVGKDRPLRERARQLLRKARVQLVFFDEPHHLTESRSDGARLGATQLGKVLVDLGHSVVFGGVHSVDDLVSASDELARRFRGRLWLGGYRLSAPENLEVLRKFADAVGSRLRHVPPVQLGSDNKWFAPLLAVCAGMPGMIAQLTLQAETRARLAGDKTLRLSHFAAAWQRFTASREKQLVHLRTSSENSLIDVFSMKEADIEAIVGEIATAKV